MIYITLDRYLQLIQKVKTLCAESLKSGSLITSTRLTAKAEAISEILQDAVVIDNKSKVTPHSVGFRNEDGCEYIKTTSIGSNNYSVTLTHKGNCKNPIHQK